MKRADRMGIMIKILSDNPGKTIPFSVFSDMTIVSLPAFTFTTAIKGVKEIDGTYIATIAAAYLPVAFVVFAEHIADHKNLSYIIGHDLIKEPGLKRTLLGDGVGSIAGTIFGICPNTTYGESVGCVAITKNASIVTITTTAIMCIILSFISPVMSVLQTIPSCVMGGVCLTLYGFIAVSGLKMFKNRSFLKNYSALGAASFIERFCLPFSSVPRYLTLTVSPTLTTSSTFSVLSF